MRHRAGRSSRGWRRFGPRRHGRGHADRCRRRQGQRRRGRGNVNRCWRRRASASSARPRGENARRNRGLRRQRPCRRRPGGRARRRLRCDPALRRDWRRCGCGQGAPHLPLRYTTVGVFASGRREDSGDNDDHAQYRDSQHGPRYTPHNQAPPVAATRAGLLDGLPSYEHSGDRAPPPARASALVPRPSTSPSSRPTWPAWDSQSTCPPLSRHSMPVRWRAHGQLWRSRGVLALAEHPTGLAPWRR